MNPRVKSVQAITDYQLMLEFTNGEYGIYDCKPLLNFGVFNELQDVNYFNQVAVMSGTVAWLHEQDICPDTLYLDSVKINSQTDWARLARRNDDEIDYSDTPAMPINPPSLRIRQPNGETIAVNNTMIAIDTDIVAWFKSRSVNYQDSINQLLREYMRHELVNDGG